MTYSTQLKQAMEMLAQNPGVLFLGQTVSYPGSSVFESLENIANERKIELPIIENVQMGMATGLSIQGFIPISIYPRMDFLIEATGQLVNHLDKIEEMSNGQFKPKVIIRTLVGAKGPLYPGIQHCSDYTEMFMAGLKKVYVKKLINAKEIVPEYKLALERRNSSLLIELVDRYNTE